MKIERAFEILRRLRDGEDPRTGRPLPAGSPVHDPDVVRALYTVLDGVPVVEPEFGPEPPSRAARPDRAGPARSRAGQPWTDDEDSRLAAGFDAGENVGKLARAFDRSPAAIRLRLVKLGRLSAEDVVTGRSRRASAVSREESAPLAEV